MENNNVPCWTQEDRPLPSKTANLAVEGKRNLVDGRHAALRPYRLVLWPLLLLLGLSTAAWGQNLHLDHWDKALYFKIRDNVQPTYEMQLRPAAGGVQMYSAFDALLGQYGMTRLYRPFAMLGTPLLERVYRVEFADSLGADSLLVRLERLPNIEWASLIPIARMDAYVPNDEGGCSSGQDALRLIHAFDAFSLHQGGNASVAIVDDAVVTSHTDLAANLLPGYEAATRVTGANATDPPNMLVRHRFDHGTHVAGIAGAVTDNSQGLASIGFMNKIVPVKTRSDNEYWGYLDYAYEGLAWAVANATSVTPNVKVINCSWGLDATLASPGVYDTYMAVAQSAADRGVLIVASAGNEGNSTHRFPAALGEYHVLGSTTTFVRDPNLVLAVSNVNFQNKKNAFSNHGTWVDIAAYGEGIIGLGFYNNNTSTYKDGTSMSAPLVAGLAGLIYSYAPNITRDQVIDALKRGSNPSFYNLPDNQPYAANMTLGSGIIDALSSLNIAAQLASVPDCAILINSINLTGPTSLSGQSGLYTLNVNYTDLNTNLFYDWNDGSTGQDLLFSPITSGINELVVTVTTRTGCTAIADICVDVTCPITPTLSVTPRPYIGLNQGVTITNTTNSPGATYSWASPPTGAILGQPSSAQFPLTPTNNGIFNVTLIATHPSGCTAQEVQPIFMGGCTNPLRVGTWPLVNNQRLSFIQGNGAYSAQATPSNPSYTSFGEESGGLICGEDGTIKLSSNGLFLFYYPPGGAQVQRIRLNGNPSSTQNSIIVQRPDGPNPFQNNRYYYIFTNNAAEGNVNGLNVHVWDEQNPTQIVSSQLFSNRATEHLTAVRHCNGKDIWIVSHEYGNNTFRAFVVTENSPVSGAITLQNVTSSVGPTLDVRAVSFSSPSMFDFNIESVGTVKPNLGGNQLAMTVFTSEGTLNSPNGGLHLFDFDNSSGIISNARQLLNNTYFYGMEFSPNGRYIYVSRSVENQNELYSGNILLQYDIATSSLLSFGYPTNYEGAGQLQLGLDGKIYHTEHTGNNIGVFNSPNQTAANAGYVTVGVRTNNMLSWGLPNTFQDYLGFSANPINAPHSVCTGSVVTVTAQHSCNGTHLWSVASSVPNGANIVGSNQNGSCVISFTEPCIVTITLVKTSLCGGPFTYQRSVTVTDLPSPPQVSMIPPTCSNPVRLDVGPGYASYNWGNNETTRYLSVTGSGVYVCTFTNTSGCSNTVAFPVTITGPVVSVTLNVLSSCLTPNDITLTASVNPSNPNYTYRWFDPFGNLLGTTTNSTLVTSYMLGEFRVEVFANSCTNIAYRDFQGAVWPVAGIYPINRQCANMPFTLNAFTQPNLSYTWSGLGISPPNNTGSTLNINAGIQRNSTYVLTVRNTIGCTATASYEVNVAPIISAPIPTTVTVCTFPYTLDAGRNVHSYLWSNNSTDRYTTISAPGTYTCTLGDSYGCQAVVSIFVSGSGNVSLTHNAPRCYVGTRPGVTITALPACSNCSYTFSGFGINASSATSNSNFRIVPFIGTYRVTMTSSGGCVSTASLASTTMTLMPQVTLATSNQSPCPGEIITLSNPLGTSGTYTWSGGGINSSGTAPSITTTFPIPGQPVTYAYTLTLFPGVGCTTTASVQVTPSNDCCTVSPTQYVLRNTSTSLAGQLVNGRAYTVIGTYKMDRTSNLSNVTFIMGPDASIEIGSQEGANPIDVNLSNCRFQACDKMWYGISVGNRTTLSMATCLVTGSLNGLMLGLQQTSAYTMPATIKISDGLFENNVRGICTPRTNAANAMSGWLDIANTRFVAGASTMPNQIPTIVRPNRAYTRTITAGIDLYQLTSQGGFNLMSGSGVNSFTGPMLTGAKFTGMSTLVSNATFMNVVTGISFNGGAANNVKNVTITNGTDGIFAQSTTLSVNTSRIIGCRNGINANSTLSTILGTGSSAALPNFSNCNRAIWSRGAGRVVARDNNIVANTGFEINRCSQAGLSTNINVSVTNNNITITSVPFALNTTNAVIPSGIGLSSNEPYGGVVSGNTIQVISSLGGGAPQGTGIAITGNAVTNVVNTTVTNNTINISNCAGAGISGNSLKNYYIYGNSINMAQPQSCKGGIVLTSSTNCTVGCNSVSGANLTANTPMNPAGAPYYPAAIVVEAGANNRLQCNNLNQIHSGILYNGSTQSANSITANTLGYHRYSLYFTGSNAIQDQIDGGNWFGPTATSVVRNDNASPNPNSSQSGALFGLIATPQSYWPANISVRPGIFINQWFKDRTAPQASCVNAGVNFCGTAVAQCQGCTESGLVAAANGQVQTSEYPEAMEWWAKKNAYQALTANDSLLVSNTVLQDFKDSLSNTELGYIIGVEQQLADELNAESNETAILSSTQSQIQLLNALLMELNEQLVLATSAGDSLVLTDSLSRVIAALNQQKSSLDLALAAYHSIQDGKLENAKLSFDALETLGTFEGLQKEMNLLLATVLKSDYLELDSTTLETAQYWAAQCPLQYGPGVYTARGIVSLVSHVSYNDALACDEVGLQFRQGQGAATKSNKYYLQPNPASDYAMFNTEEPLSADSELIFYDMLGKPALGMNAPKGTSLLDLDLTELKPAVYNVVLKSQGELLSNWKLIVIRD